MPFRVLRPTALFSTPAPWSALLLFSALCLQGCSLLPRGEDSESTGSAPTPAIAESGTPSFAVQVNAPANVRETLERHLELQRFRTLRDLDANELERQGKNSHAKVRGIFKRHLTEGAGKTVIQCADRPGFIVNRCARPYYGEALALLSEGRTAAEIDAAITAAGYPIGPFGLIDLIGADINLAATESLWHAMGNHPRYHVFGALKAQVASGQIGRKSLKGFIFPDDPPPPPEDAAAIALEVPEVQVAAPSSRATVQAVYGNSNWSTPVFGATNDYLEARDWPLESGRMFETAELQGAAKVALIGKTVARELFGEQDPIDQVVFLSTREAQGSAREVYTTRIDGRSYGLLHKQSHAYRGGDHYVVYLPGKRDGVSLAFSDDKSKAFKLADLQASYERHRRADGHLPATYDVILLALRKPLQPARS